jgi:hypothetical protein
MVTNYTFYILFALHYHYDSNSLTYIMVGEILNASSRNIFSNELSRRKQAEEANKPPTEEDVYE